jgi:predicted DNA-binding transcriptional regulator YafY
VATNQATLLRQWHMLRLIPRAPGKITVQDIHSRLASEDFDVTVRTIQRDLHELAQAFPLTVDERDRPFGWSWQKDAQSFDLPGIAVPEALMLSLAEQHLVNHLPPAILDTLRPSFRSAERTLAHAQGKASTRSWLGKVRSVMPTQPLIAPEVDSASQRTVYEALMHDRQLKLTYQKRGAPQPVVYESVHPLGVVQRGQLIYLVCVFADYDDLRLLAMHRIVCAESLYEAARKPAGFCIDAYIQSGALGFGSGENITLCATFTRKAGEHLLESRIRPEQAMAELPDGRLQLTATVPNTKELHWWLLGFGDSVEVIEPASLREQMKQTISRMGSLYGQAPAAAG